MNIYEIKFNNVDYNSVILKMNRIGHFSINNTVFYVATKFTKVKIRNVFKGELKTVSEINKNNYMSIKSDMCRQWCYDILLKSEMLSYEKSHQKELKQINNKLDFLLELKKQGKLEEYLKNGGEDIGEKDKDSTNK